MNGNSFGSIELGLQIQAAVHNSSLTFEVEEGRITKTEKCHVILNLHLYFL